MSEAGKEELNPNKIIGQLLLCMKGLNSPDGEKRKEAEGEWLELKSKVGQLGYDSVLGGLNSRNRRLLREIEDVFEESHLGEQVKSLAEFAKRERKRGGGAEDLEGEAYFLESQTAIGVSKLKDEMLKIEGQLTVLGQVQGAVLSWQAEASQDKTV